MPHTANRLTVRGKCCHKRECLAPGTYTATTCRGRGLNYGSHTYFFDHTRTWRFSPDEGSAQCRGHLRENTNMKETIHTIQEPIHSSKTNMKGWLWRPNYIRGPCGPKSSWHLSYRWGKIPEKPHSANLSRSGIEPDPAAWQARMLTPSQYFTRASLITGFTWETFSETYASIFSRTSSIAYLRFQGVSNLRSLAPVMNDDWWWC